MPMKNFKPVRPPAAEVDQYLQSLSGEAGLIATQLVALIRNQVSDHTECVYAGAPWFSTELGEPFAYVNALKDHVNLGLCNYGLLDDPDGLIEGQGKTIRHVKFRSFADLSRPSAIALIQQAAQLARDQAPDQKD